jgi:hypothetical protein
MNQYIAFQHPVALIEAYRQTSICPTVNYLHGTEFLLMKWWSRNSPPFMETEGSCRVPDNGVSISVPFFMRDVCYGKCE